LEQAKREGGAGDPEVNIPEPPESQELKLSAASCGEWLVGGFKKDGRKRMKKIVQTLLLTAFVILTTASFSYAEYAAAGSANFPYFHLGCLIVGGLIILSLKNRYPRLYLSEAIGSFALFTVLVALFTSPVVETLKTLVG
jgi:hypothetical protein